VAAVRLRKIKEEYGDKIRVEWHAYPLAIQQRAEARISEHSIEGRQRAGLEQEGICFNPWNEDVPYPVTSMPAVRASYCVRQQSLEAFERLHLVLFKTFFGECRNIQEETLLFSLVKDAGVDMRRFRVDYEKAAVDEEILADHKFYAENFLGWGIPLALIGDRFPLAGAVPIEMYHRAIDLCLGTKKSGDK
jgi:predicted DsbA family dithiol-disulfide isomerase